LTNTVVHVVDALICCSIGVATDCSNGLRVGADVRCAHLHFRRRDCRNCDTGRLTIVIASTIHRQIEITMATIGAIDKNFDIAPPAFADSTGTAFTGAPSRTFWSPSTTNSSPDLTLGDNPQVATRSQLYGPKLTLLSAPRQRPVDFPEAQSLLFAEQQRYSGVFTDARTRPYPPGRSRLLDSGKTPAIRIVPVAGFTSRSAK